MVVAWLYLTPIAVYIARYGKDFFERPSLWFSMHKWGSILSGMIYSAQMGQYLVRYDLVEAFE